MIEELFEQKEKDLILKANKARQLLIETVTAAGSGHSGGPLGMADIFTLMYFHVLNHDPQNPTWEDRDRLVLSNGHICPIRYVLMAMSGYFPLEELKTLRKLHSRLQGHPHRTALPGVETTSGPLGEGISQAIGIALAARLDKKKYHVHCIASDGELQEGNSWEAIMLGGKVNVSSLTLLIDRNNIQIDGPTETIMPLEPLKDKFISFNWNTIEVDGHNMRQIVSALRLAQTINEKPTVIIAHTIPGKGVSFMENRYEWHGNPPDVVDVKGAPPKGKQAAKALEELKNEEERLKKTLRLE